MADGKELVDLTRAVKDLRVHIRDLASVCKAINENLIEIHKKMVASTKEVDVSWVTTEPGEPGRKEK